jgi:hypothetical protein
VTGRVAIEKPDRCLVPKPTVTLEDVRRLAAGLGWQPHGTVLPGPDAPYEEIWKTGDGQTGIHWIEDEEIDVTYLLVEGENPDAVRAEIQARLDVYGVDELRELLTTASDIAVRVHAVYAIGVDAKGPFDQSHFDLLLTALRDPDPLIRRVAAIASTFPAWPELREPLERLRDVDEDPEVRAVAGQALAALRRIHQEAAERDTA